MLDLRPFQSLGRMDIDWLSARYHFSFADYYDRSRMGLGPLRVWNDDTIRAGTGFPPHGHRDMEIITYVRHGAVTHEDGLGNQGRTQAGDVQVMSAGTGIMHAEYNREPEDTTLFQIWIQTNARGHAPRWETRTFPTAETGSGLRPLASGRAADLAAGALPIHADATLLGGVLAPGDRWSMDLSGRAAYLVPARGSLTATDDSGATVTVSLRDGLAVTDTTTLTLTAGEEETEVVLVDVRL